MTDEKYTGTEKCGVCEETENAESTTEVAKNQTDSAEMESCETITAVKKQHSETDGGNQNQTEKDFSSCTIDVLYRICDKFPDENVMNDISSEAFRIFSAGKKGDPENIYCEFLGLKKAFGKNVKFAKQELIKSESTVEPSRSHSGFTTETPYRDVSSGLTKRQMQMARESGMSFREYEDLLNSVPGAKRLR